MKRCDHCGLELHRDSNGWWVGADDTSECDAFLGGHQVDGDER